MQNQQDLEFLSEHIKVKKRQKMLARRHASVLGDRSKQHTPLDLISSDESQETNLKQNQLLQNVTTDHQGNIIKIEKPVLQTVKILQPKVNLIDPQLSTHSEMVSTKSKLVLKSKKNDSMAKLSELANQFAKMDIASIDQAELLEDLTNVKLMTKYKNHLIAMYQAKQLDQERAANDSSSALEKKKSVGESKSVLRKLQEDSALRKLLSKENDLTKKVQAIKNNVQTLNPITVESKRKTPDNKSQLAAAAAHSKKLFGADVDKVLNHPTIVHPSKIFMSNLLNSIELSQGTMIKDHKDQIIRAGNTRPIESNKIRVKDYKKLKETQLQLSIMESQMSRRESQSIRFQDFDLSIKPESATQIKEDVYISGDNESNFLRKKSSVNFLGDQIIIDKENFRARRNKSVLPQIKGVNQKSLQLLAEHQSEFYSSRRNSINQSPDSSIKLGIFKTRNQSLPVDSIQRFQNLDLQSPPLYSSIVSNARQELQGEKTQILREKSQFSRKKQTGAPKHIKDQINEIMQKTQFNDKVRLSDNAAQILKSVRNVEVKEPPQIKKKSSMSIGGQNTLDIQHQIANLGLQKLLLSKSNMKAHFISTTSVNQIGMKPEIKFEDLSSRQMSSIGGFQTSLLTRTPNTRSKDQLK